MPNSEQETQLRERIDDLSTWLLLGETGDQGAGLDTGHFLSMLAELARQAGDSGYHEAAKIADELRTAFVGSPSGSWGIGPFQDALVRLQQAITATPSAPVSDVAAAGDAAPVFSLASDPELVADFVLESREHLTAIEQHILTLEREPDNAEVIHSVFRGFHTIKGLAGFLEFAPVQEIAHEVETSLNLAREGQLAITPAVIDVILEAVDYLRRSIAEIESGVACVRLPGHDRLLDRTRELTAVPRSALDVSSLAPEVPVMAPAAESEVQPPPAPCPCPESGAITDEVAHPRPEAGVPAQPKSRQTSAESTSVRVDTAKLDYLVDMVGEMVIAQSMVRHNQTVSVVSDPGLQRDLTQLSRLTGEVQRTAMAMRMVPIGQLFQRANRQVRDLSRKTGKEVELATRGEETQLDKTIAEELADPLMHMVRNSIDHGIELPADRVSAGKAPSACITLAAYHLGGQIVIEVSDDGRGLDAGKILAKARQKGIVQDDFHPMEADIFRLILEPGFSTAEKVTDISGRGVGMDVVRRQVEKLRGRIEIRTRLGQGTTFLIRLPLTMAIIDGLVVAVGCHRYIVPLFAVTEMFRPAAESIFTLQNRQEMAMVRGRLLPVLRLYRRFGLTPRTEVPAEALLIVTESEGQRFCLLVDELIGKQEVVIKSLGEGLRKVPGIAGGAILGDGRVGLILEMGGLWRSHASV